MCSRVRAGNYSLSTDVEFHSVQPVTTSSDNILQQDKTFQHLTPQTDCVENETFEIYLLCGNPSDPTDGPLPTCLVVPNVQRRWGYVPPTIDCAL